MSAADGCRTRITVAATISKTAITIATTAIQLSATTKTAAISTNPNVMPCAATIPAPCNGPTTNNRIASIKVSTVNKGSPNCTDHEAKAPRDARRHDAQLSTKPMWISNRCMDVSQKGTLQLWLSRGSLRQAIACVALSIAVAFRSHGLGFFSEAACLPVLHSGSATTGLRWRSIVQFSKSGTSWQSFLVLSLLQQHRLRP